MKRFAIIMAGGSGTRFWPKSTKQNPKQLVALTGPKSMIQMTWNRLDGLVEPRNRAVVTTQALSTKIKKQLGAKTWLLNEPEGRNTMAAVAWSAWAVFKKDPEAVVALLPADAHIADVVGFKKALSQAYQVADREDRIVCLGITPTFAATGYGYIEGGDALSDDQPALHIRRFVEKPTYEKANEYLNSRKYFWNAGIFVFKARVFVDETRLHAPEFAKAFDQVNRSPGKLKSIYKALPRVPVDIALMEKTDRGAVIPSTFGWNDVGSWTALDEVIESNSPAGLIRAPGGFEAIDCQGLIVDTTAKKFVGLIGVKDLIIVETENALMICAKNQAQSIKQLVGSIEGNPKLKKRLL